MVGFRMSCAILISLSLSILNVVYTKKYIPVFYQWWMDIAVIAADLLLNTKIVTLLVMSTRISPLSNISAAATVVLDVYS